MSRDEIIEEGEVHNLSSNIPGRYALWVAIKRVRSKGAPQAPTPRLFLAAHALHPILDVCLAWCFMCWVALLGFYLALCFIMYWMALTR